MNTLDVLIVDDESSSRDLIRSLLSDVDGIHIIADAECVQSALPLIEEFQPDVILLDIQMPREDGFVLIERMAEEELYAEIIFVTAYDQYAIKAIKAAAFDYLLKPVRKSDLVESLLKLSTKVESDRQNSNFSKLMYYLSDNKKLKFRNRTGFVMIDPNQIIYCQADLNYTDLIIEGGKNLKVSMNLGKVEELLPGVSFCRISRSIIVNVDFLVQVDRKNMVCELTDYESHHLNVSKKYLKSLENYCKDHFDIDN